MFSLIVRYKCKAWREVRESLDSFTSRMNFLVGFQYPEHEVQLFPLFCTSRFQQTFDNLTSELQSNLPINIVGDNSLSLNKVTHKPAFQGRRAGISSCCKSIGWLPRKRFSVSFLYVCLSLLGEQL